MNALAAVVVELPELRVFGVTAQIIWEDGRLLLSSSLLVEL